MAKNLLPSSMEHSDDEDYIDIEVNSYFSSCSNSSSPQNRVFEFQITNYNTTSPADELFYRGRLLPLHQKILQTQLFEEEEEEEDSFCINFFITPIGSPSQTCRLSFELNPNDHKIRSKKLWSKLIKHSLITQKFKSSRTFLKSLFTKSSCKNSSSCSSKDMKVSKKKTTNGTSCDNKGLSSRWHISPTKCLSSSSTNSSTSGGSFSSSNCSFNTNNGFTSEDSIEAAVAHCKKSQQCGWAYKDIDN